MSRRGPLAAFFCLGLMWGAWAALAPAVQTAVGASKGAFGLALLFVAIGSVPAMLTTGRELDRRGTAILPWLLVGFALATLLPAFVGSVPALAASLLAVGVFTGATDVAMNAAVSELEAKLRIRLMQLAHALYSAGVLAGALATGLARQAGAGRVEVLGGVAVALLIAAALNLRHEPHVRRAAAATARPGLSRAAIPLGIACGAAFVIEGGMENWGAIFLERDLDAGPAVSALAPAAYGGAMMLGRLSGQWLERRVGDALLLAGAVAVALVGLLLASTAPTVPVAIGAFFVGGAGISIAAPVLFGAGGRLGPPEERGRDLATVTTLGYLGFLVGPPVVGGLAEAAGLRASFAALALLAAALVAAIPRLGLSRTPYAGSSATSPTGSS
ncbi:MAG TPA: MFS transporter [Gaiellaceae bacterium]